MPPKKEGSKSTLNSTKKGGKTAASKASDASSASAAPAAAPVTNPSPTSATASPATTATTSPVSPASATAIEIASAQPVADKKTSEAGAYPHVPKVLRNTTVGQSYEKLYESTTLHPKKPDPVSVFGLTTTDLKECVDFDERNSKELVDRLNSARFGGVEGVARALKVDLELGLVSGTPSAEALSSPASDASAKKAKKKVGTAQAEVPAFVDKLAFGRERFSTFGQNLVPPPASENVFQIILGTIKGDALIKILLAGALIVLIAGSVKDPKEGWIDGMAILVAVIIVLTVTAWNDWSKDKKFKKLLTLQSDKKAKVIRDGKQLLISSWDVLVGDLIELLPGDEVAADGIFVRGLNLSIDESPLTGETIPLRKSAKSPFLFSGCTVNEGSGVMIATAVGVHSTAGQIQELLNQEQQKQTPLQKKLEALAVEIGKLGFAAGVFTFLGLVIRWGVKFSTGELVWSPDQAIAILKFFIIGVTVVVLAVPEGLPVAVTIALAFSMFKMIRDNCFVRHLSASETMGQATSVCTDKTGTLTENRMKVVKIYAHGQFYNGEGSAAADSKPFSSTTFGEKFRDLFAEATSLNSTCFVQYKPNNPLPVFVGSATEGALLVVTGVLGSKYEDVRKAVKKVEKGELPFSSERKMMATLVEPMVVINGKQAKYRSYAKGASEIVLANCYNAVNVENMTSYPLTADRVEEINKLIKQLASEGLRTIVLAYKDMDALPPADPVTGLYQQLDTNLTFIGLVGIKDPIRPEVPKAVADCQHAGIVVRMVTGDNILTACTIAKECGIMTDDGIAIEGPAFRALSEEEKIKILPRLQVLARSSPTDKYILVTLLKKMGEVVAVTGDGTNDAPALKASDVGFAMGISGTQVAMNACKILLLDDNFASIVQAIRWGRNVLEVIQKFLQFQLSVNLAAVALTFFGSVIQGEPPMSAVQLLWINLVMDSLGALALASEEPPEDVLDRPPQSATDPVFTTNMKQYVGALTVYQFSVVMFVLFKGYEVVGVNASEFTKIHTLVFCTFVMMQVVNEVLARQLNHELNFVKGIFNNLLFVGLILSIIIIQALAVQFGGEFFSTTGLNAVEWAGCIVLTLLQIPYILLMRAGVRAYRTWKAKRRVEPINSNAVAMQAVVVDKKL